MQYYFLLHPVIRFPKMFYEMVCAQCFDFCVLMIFLETANDLLANCHNRWRLTIRNFP